MSGFAFLVVSSDESGHLVTSISDLEILRSLSFSVSAGAFTTLTAQDA